MPKNNKDTNLIAEEEAGVIGFDSSGNQIIYKCIKCGDKGKVDNPVTKVDFQCDSCGKALFLYNYDLIIEDINRRNSRNRELKQQLTPFIVSGITGFLLYLTSNVSLSVAFMILLVGGFVGLFLYAIIFS